MFPTRDALTRKCPGDVMRFRYLTTVLAKSEAVSTSRGILAVIHAWHRQNTTESAHRVNYARYVVSQRKPSLQ